MYYCPQTHDLKLGLSKHPSYNNCTPEGCFLHQNVIKESEKKDEILNFAVGSIDFI